MDLFAPLLPASVRRALAARRGPSAKELGDLFATEGAREGGGGNGVATLWSRDDVEVLVEGEEREEGRVGKERGGIQRGKSRGGGGGDDTGGKGRRRRRRFTSVSLRIAVCKDRDRTAMRLSSGWKALLAAAGATEIGAFVLLERFDESGSDDGGSGRGGGGGRRGGGEQKGKGFSSTLVAIKAGHAALPSREAAIAGWKREGGWSAGVAAAAAAGAQRNGKKKRWSGSSTPPPRKAAVARRRAASDDDDDGPLLPWYGNGTATAAFPGGPVSYASTSGASQKQQQFASSTPRHGGKR